MLEPFSNARRHRTGPLVALLAAVLALAAAGVAVGERLSSGEIGPSLHITGNGHFLHPAGRLTTVGNFPTGSAVQPGGRFLWVADCGYGKDDVQVVNIHSGTVIQTLPLPGCYGGVAFAPDGRHAYVSGTPMGIFSEGPTKGNQGDVVHIFTVDPRTGKAVEQDPLQLPPTTGGSGRVNSLPPVSGVGTAQPEGLAVSPDGRWLVVALNGADKAVVVDLSDMTQRLVDIGEYPDGVAFDPQGRAYVSNEYSGTVSVIDPVTATVTTTISGLGGQLGDLGSHPEGMVADPHRPALYVAVTNRDLVAVVDTRTDTVSHLISVARAPVLGTAPTDVAISPDGNTLYSSDSGEDAVAAISLTDRPSGSHGRRHRRRRFHGRFHGYIPNFRAFQLIGRIPTAAYPDSVQTTPQGKLIWVAAKGFGSGPNPDYGSDNFAASQNAPYGSYVLEMLIGRVGTLPIPTDEQVLHQYTPIANAQSRPVNSESQPAGSPIPAVTGQPSSEIKHVFYIVRENRTYDQIFGTDKRGNGDPSLEVLDDNGVKGPTGGITPNAHSLARQFPLFDNFYEDSEVSNDGHLITTGAYATDYVQKATAANYSGRRTADDEGIYPVTYPPNFFIFDQAAKQNVSFRDYGEAVGALNIPTPNRPELSKVLANVAPYPNNVFIGCPEAGVHSSCAQDSGTYKGTGTIWAGQSRFNDFLSDFDAELKSNSVPTFNYMILPNDHTNGTTPGDPTPKAMVADNDLALGQIVDAISHSSIWPSTAIFVEEDDSQDGADHVDSHRAPAFVISPWARRGVTINTRYDQYSMLRTIELITGLDPLSLNDALATPMYNAFISGSQKPDDAPYNVIQPTYPLNTFNTAMSPDAKLSKELPWNRLDAVPQAMSDEILWASVFGTHKAAPKPGPNASPDEVDRAVEMRALLREEQQTSAVERALSRVDKKQRASTRCPITWACKANPPGDA